MFTSMNLPALVCCIFAILALSAASHAHAVSTDDLQPRPKNYADEQVAGMTQSELTQRWWQWAASFQYADSPVSDSTGERCGAGQEGPVWFLAGTYGSAPARRTRHIPAGKDPFFSLLKQLVMP